MWHYPMRNSYPYIFGSAQMYHTIGNSDYLFNTLHISYILFVVSLQNSLFSINYIDFNWCKIYNYLCRLNTFHLYLKSILMNI